MTIVRIRAGATRRRAAGFTLIELMLVVTIIGILAAVSLPAYQEYTLRGKVAEGMVLNEIAKVAVKEYYDRWGVLPADNARAGLPRANAIRGRYVESVSVQNGVIEIVFDKDALPATEKARSLFFLPGIQRDAPTAPLAWLCGSPGKDRKVASFEFPAVAREREIRPQLRPGSCRG